MRPETEAFVDLSQVIDEPCTWSNRGLIHSEYTLVTADKKSLIMRLRKNQLSLHAEVAWHGFRGTRDVDQLGPVKFPFLSILASWLLLPLQQKEQGVLRDEGGDIVALDDRQIGSCATHITTQSNVYDMRLRAGTWTGSERRRLVVSDSSGDIVVSDWSRRCISVLRYVEDVGPLLLLAWGFMISYSDI